MSNFGWLEEIIKRTIYALDKARLADDLTESDLHSWLSRMSSLADDSMGTLIDQLDAAMRRHPGIGQRDRITHRLHEIKRQRNLLCHASWRPTEDPARWHPAFVGNHGEIFDHALSPADLEAIASATVEAGRTLLGVMKSTGIAGRWAGDDES